MKLSNFLFLLAFQLLFFSNVNASANESFKALPWSTTYNTSIPGDAIFKGRVLDQNNDPIPAAWVIVNELSSGVLTTNGGYFYMSVPPGTYTISVGYIGCASQSDSITLAADVITTTAIRLECELLNAKQLQFKKIQNSTFSINHSKQTGEINYFKKDTLNLKNIRFYLNNF